MAQELTEELKVFVTAEVNNAISNLQKVDKQTKAAESSFKVLGKTITAAFIATEIIKFSKQSINAWENQKQAVDVLNSTLQATGATAWTSSRQLQEMASSLQQITNYGDETIIQMQSVLLGFKNIKGDTFEDATKAILDMATVMKMDLSSAAQAVGKALDDPINGITSLQRQGFRFSESQKAVIQSLIDAGDTAGAQKIIIDELNTTYGGAAEAAVKATTQIKNAWDDLQEGVGSFLSGFVNNEFGQKIATVLGVIGEAFATFHDNVAFLYGITSEEAFARYYSRLTDIEEEITAATIRSSQWQKEVDKLNKSIEEGSRLSKKELENLQKDLAYAQDRVDAWESLADLGKENLEHNQKLAKQEADMLDAENKIKDLMHQIGLDYEKLSKDDPVIQLENYQKELEKIAKDKETLSLNTTDVDTSKAIRQLDYNAEQIKSKMKEIRDKLQDDGKKSWQEYFQDVTGVSSSTFTTGKEAGQLYIDGLKKSFDDAQSLSVLLEKKFDAKAAIESQMADLEKTITTLLNIPADKIDEVYSEADNNIKLMIDEYKRLNSEKQQYENTDALEELNNRLQQLTMKERELYILKLQSNNATDEQIEKANELFDLIEAAQKKAKDARKDENDAFVSWEDSLEKFFISGIEKLQLFKENADESNKSLAELGTTLAGISLNAVMNGLGAIGEALGEGESAGKGLKNALEDMATTILNQLPMLFLQAGLQLIAQGQWPLGLSLVATGLGTQFVSGFNQGIANKTEANALGNVYGSEVSAFANGGTFTNQIVSSPTLFKFARGGKMGTGLMGEAGPEAIMPLKRGADGTLGVEASGSQINFALMVEVNNYSQERVQTQETTDENGQRRLQIMIGSAINSHITSGKADKALSSRYGLKAQGV